MAIRDATQLEQPVGPSINLPTAYPRVPDKLTRAFPEFAVYHGELEKLYRRVREAIRTSHDDLVLPLNGVKKESKGHYASIDGLTASITEERDARASADEAIATSITNLTATVTGNYSALEAAISSEQTARISGDEALATSITNLSATVTSTFTTVNAAITAEQTARANGDSALATSISSLTATVTGNFNTLNSAITSEQTARTQGDEALATSVTNLTTTVTNNFSTLNASITAEQTARSNADSALATRATTLESQVQTPTTGLLARMSTVETTYATQTFAEAKKSEAITASNSYTDAEVDGEASARVAAILAEATARQDADASEASARAAAITAVNASIATEATARTNADTALAGRATTLEAQVQTAGTGLLARMTAVETTYATQTFAESKKSEAISAANSYTDSEITDEANARAAAILAEATARQDADAAEATARTGAITAVNASIATEATARTNADTALAARAATLESQVQTPTTGLLARMTTVETTYATQAFAETKKSEAISAANGYTDSEITDAASALNTAITNEAVARQNADDAEASARTSAISAVNASIATEATTRATAVSALSTRADTLESQVQTAGTGLLARMNTVETTYATQTFAEAKKTEAITASNGYAAGIVATEAATRATKDGYVESSYTLVAAAGNVISGMRFISSSGTTPVSEVVFQVEKFKIFNGTTGVQTFSVDGSGNVSIGSSITIGNAQVSGLGSLATKNSVAAGTSDITGLGTLATKNSVAAGTGDITGLGALATQNSVAWSGLTGRPVELTDGRIATALNSAGTVVTRVVPASAASPGGSGLYLGSDRMGFFNGSAWRTYMDNSGNFFLSGSSGNALAWDGSTLSIVGTITSTNGTIAGFTVSPNKLYAGSGSTYVELGNLGGGYLQMGSLSSGPVAVFTQSGLGLGNGSNNAVDMQRTSGGYGLLRLWNQFNSQTISLDGSSGTISATSFSGNGNNLNNLNASNIGSGTLSNSRLAFTVGSMASQNNNFVDINGGDVSNCTSNGFNYDGGNRIKFLWNGANVVAYVDNSAQGVIPN